MANPLRKLFGSGTSSADIAVAIDKARSDLEAAETAVVTTEQAYDENLLTADKKSLRAFLDAKTEAGIDVDQARARIQRLERDHEAAIEAEAADRRQVAYEKARASSEAARKRLTSEYPRLAKEVRALLKTIAESDVMVDTANEDLPDGAKRLEKAEDFRSQATRYREELGQSVVDAWVPVGDRSTPLPDEMQRRVRPEERERRDGTLHGQVQVESGRYLDVERRRFTRVEFLQHDDGHTIDSLASSLNLPALYAGASPFWVASDYRPPRVLAELEKSLLSPPARAERTVEVEWRNPPKETADDRA